jgi:hypothetical protein
MLVSVTPFYESSRSLIQGPSTQNGIAVAYVSSTNKILINQYSKLTANLSVVTSYTAVAGTGISLARADYSSNFLVLAWQDAAGPSTSFVDQSVTPGSWSWSAPARYVSCADTKFTWMVLCLTLMFRFQEPPRYRCHRQRTRACIHWCPLA